MFKLNQKFLLLSLNQAIDFQLMKYLKNTIRGMSWPVWAGNDSLHHQNPQNHQTCNFISFKSETFVKIATDEYIR